MKIDVNIIFYDIFSIDRKKIYAYIYFDENFLLARARSHLAVKLTTKNQNFIYL